MHHLETRRPLLGLAIALALGGCSTASRQLHLPESLVSSAPPLEAPAPVLEDRPASPPPKDGVYKGTGQFVRSPVTRVPDAGAPGVGEVTLNFENTDVHEVVKVVIGDLLKQNYAIDPAVKGSISVQTSRPIRTEALLPLMENLLRMNGAALVRNGEGYRIVPLTGAMRGATPSMDRRLPTGFRVQVVPLRYIAVQEMQKILEPFVSDGGLMKVDERRNLIILAGSSGELQGWLDTIDTFDVDWLKGYSVGIFPLENADAKTVAAELQKIIGGEGKDSMIRLEPMERLNAILVVTPQPAYLDQMKTWVDRLDRAGGGPGSRLYVYQAKNRKASELADVLGELFFGRKRARTEPVRLAPGLEPARLTTAQFLQPPGLRDTARREILPSPYSTPGLSGAGQTPATSQQPLNPPGGGENALTVVEGAGVRVVADEANNSILVYASAEDYRVIEQALKRLDVEPQQVLVEASIIEVSLTDELKYGLEWFFKNRGIVNNRTGQALLDLNKAASGPESLATIIPGFSYSLVNAAGEITAVLNALAQESKVNVLSSPSLMVLDNRTAEIRVGDQVPVILSNQESYSGLSLLQAYQYRDTGVRLKVTPRVNSGGLVTLDIVQEVTDIGGKDPDTKQYTFLQRSIESVVAVQGGQTIVLGGLILENRTDAERGIPGVYKVPVFGKLFGATEESTKRTELLVMLTPRVVRNQKEAAEVTEEFRQRLRSLQPAPKPATTSEKAPEGS
ncbi:type II secretion system secretin GspD [Thiofaba sp. EF100]|uniref:type II secretion system secretin GspD n=1 Tax=Thiofaba sp. EF100 TaxID=3121274 RepID=UPI003221FB5F